MDDEQQIAWIGMHPSSPVLDAEGDQIGTAESLLGDESEDIFHGIVVKLKDGRHVEVPALKVEKITAAKVHLSVKPDEVAGLPDYREEHWFHLGWGGLFRKHPEWKETDRT
ncbi:MAG TPA: hypothetical protein VIO84_04605 [Candidatus Dormibacteraeota bacterium]|jgi:hypothetical protein